jgi:hypothetical protein
VCYLTRTTISSGAGFGRRARYTDSSEFAVSGSRSVILNGLKNAIRKSDLADRTVVLNMTRISSEHRRSHIRLKQGFEQERGLIFGALLDAVAHGLREHPRVQLKRAPRMVDFCEWGIACEGAYAATGAFLAAFEWGATEATEGVIEVNPVAVVVLAFMADRISWQGTATQLYAQLVENDPSEQKATRDPAWPKGVVRFGIALRGVETVLRKAGVELLLLEQNTPGEAAGVFWVGGSTASGTPLEAFRKAGGAFWAGTGPLLPRCFPNNQRGSRRTRKLPCGGHFSGKQQACIDNRELTASAALG